MKLRVANDEGHCDNCENIRPIIVLEGYNGSVSICLECQFPVQKKINEVAIQLNGGLKRKR